MGQVQRQTRCRIDRTFELLVVWVLIASVVGLVSTLAGHFLAPQVWLGSLLLAGVYGWCTHRASYASGISFDWRHLVLLTLVCLFFRLPGYHYVLGGQDEGVYVNISHYIEQTGGVTVKDTVLEKLKGSAYVGSYLAENRVNGYLPGVYAPSPAGIGLEFQFYHLFPVWMAMFSGVFGSTFGIYALTFFSWLSILFFYQLTLVISKSRSAALTAGLLLALNPLHAFFSKFPVTEIPTLTFSLIGFTYLAAFWNSGDPSGRYRWLWMSAIAFGALFVTRISGFIYLPFIVALAVASAIMDPHPQRRRAVFWWGLSVVILYTLSVLYGLHWSASYANDIYDASFGRIFKSEWPLGVAVAVVLGLLIWAATVFFARSDSMRGYMSRYLVAPVRSVIGVIVAFGLLGGLFKIYRLGWTGSYLQDPWLAGRWQLADSGVTAVEASSLFALVVYMGPLLPTCFLFFVMQRQKDPCIEFLRLFVAGIFVYVTMLLWTVPYGPYYARYLLSEMIPYLSIFVILVWSCLKSSTWKKAVAFMLSMSLIYMAFASAAQLGKSENDGLYSSLKKLLSPVDQGDLVLVDSTQSGRPGTTELKTSIIYTFGRNVVTVNGKSLHDHGYIEALDARYDDVFLISERSTAPFGFEYQGGARIKHVAFQKTYLYPRDLFLVGDRRLYLFRLSRSVIPLSHKVVFDRTGQWNDWMSTGWSGSEEWGTWSLGQHAELIIDPRQLPEATNGLRLSFDAKVFVTPKHPHQRIEVSVNDAEAGNYEVEFPTMGIGFDLTIPPEALESTRKIRIAFDLPDAISPNSLGGSNDVRALALGLRTLTVTALSETPPATEVVPATTSTPLRQPPVNGKLP